ncbi:DUF4351 domain-containing protein [Cylindrospermopsis raciborskii]|nr:DUF4351 domain-containing protein [Cylindrospermopsis raciborskii]
MSVPQLEALAESLLDFRQISGFRSMVKRRRKIQ